MQRLRSKEATNIIINILRNAKRPLTTREVEREIEKKRVICPDAPPIFLNKLRLRGVILGKFSSERKAWIWWVK